MWIIAEASDCVADGHSEEHVRHQRQYDAASIPELLVHHLIHDAAPRTTPQQSERSK
jgi:hypothetical protein